MKLKEGEKKNKYIDLTWEQKTVEHVTRISVVFGAIGTLIKGLIKGQELPRGVMVIVIGNGHGDTSSNPGRDWLHFT